MQLAAIAQLVEHFIRNEKVVGSSPTRGSKLKQLKTNLLKVGFSLFITKATLYILKNILTFEEKSVQNPCKENYKKY